MIYSYVRGLNETKLATPLDQWVRDNNISLENQLIPNNVSLEVKAFRSFYEKRKNLLKKRLKWMIDGELDSSVDE